MTAYLVLIPAMLLGATCAYLSYSDHYRGSWWYVPSACVMGALTTWLWFVGAGLTADRNATYRLGVAWSVEAELCWFFVPLFFCGVRFGWLAVLGLTLLLCGVLLIHADGGAAR